MLKLVFLAILSVPSILAASIAVRERITGALVAEKDTGKLGQTFQRLHEIYGNNYSSYALSAVAEQGHPEMVVTCLRAVPDPFPNDKMRVSGLVHYTLLGICPSTFDDSESFAKVITSFKPTDVKPLASIRFCTLCRKDAVSVLGGVMAKSRELIIGALPNWLANHEFDRNSIGYDNHQTAREGAFQYLASFATESALEKALSIVKNEHYEVDFEDGPVILCCKSRNHVPPDLVDRLTGLLELLKARNELVKAALSFMPTVLLKLLAEYITYETA
jgi:hypothetical protein